MYVVAINAFCLVRTSHCATLTICITYLQYWCSFFLIGLAEDSVLRFDFKLASAPEHPTTLKNYGRIGPALIHR